MILTERITVPFAVKAIDEKAGTFRGLAAAWSKDLGNDVIHKGAFARTLGRWRAAEKRWPIPLLDSHDRHRIGAVLGKMVDAAETNDGLDAVFEWVPDDDIAAAAKRRVKGGFVTGLSIGYEAVTWEDGKGVRNLKEVKLHEVSLVMFPMNEDARIDPSSVKSLVDAVRAGTLTEEDKQELRALLAAPAAVAAPPAGLAPDDPARIALDWRVRDLKLRRLAASA